MNNSLIQSPTYSTTLASPDQHGSARNPLHLPNGID